MDSRLKRIKKSVVLFFNSYWLKEYYMLLKYYRWPARGEKSAAGPRPKREPMLISMVDNRRQGKGLTDRFKGIVSIYALAKAENLPYRCIFNHPCQLSDFLVPNAYNWLPRPGELADEIDEVRIKLLRKQATIKRLLKALPLKKQMRVYANLDYLNEINRVYRRNFHWGDLFKELFKPSPLLEDRINVHRERLGARGYNACVFRFQALLGDFQEYNCKPLPPAEKRRLIAANKDALLQVVQTSDLPVLVTSDSTTFLSEVRNLENVYTIPGKVVHIDNVGDATREVYLKSFVDFFMLSHARHIYGMGTPRMYRSDFPRYAAKINRVPFERVVIE